MIWSSKSGKISHASATPYHSVYTGSRYNFRYNSFCAIQFNLDPRKAISKKSYNFLSVAQSVEYIS
jgi:hypothetical protein